MHRAGGHNVRPTDSRTRASANPTSAPSGTCVMFRPSFTGLSFSGKFKLGGYLSSGYLTWKLSVPPAPNDSGISKPGHGRLTTALQGNTEGVMQFPLSCRFERCCISTPKLSDGLYRARGFHANPCLSGCRGTPDDVAGGNLTQ